LIVPVVPEAQELAQLVKFLTMLDRTRRERPFTRTLGILPVRCIERWAEHRTILAQARTVAADFDVPLLPPVPFSRAVSRYSLAGGLWRHVAELLMATCEAGTARAAA
jgi:cellulose biosynthesis protein BcsQ